MTTNDDSYHHVIVAILDEMTKAIQALARAAARDDSYAYQQRSLAFELTTRAQALIDDLFQST